jgi:ubiquinone/menaquinone biosynthesis C-methylase UbiE
VTFEAKLADRNASDYADFLLPYLTPTFRVLDVGCGDGAISIGLGKVAGHVVGVDPDEDAFEEARRYATRQGIENVDFRAGDVYSLGLPDNEFDACLCHSVLEVIDRPLDALHEIKRTLKPGGAFGAASVEYGGVILAGPRRGRALRALLTAAGFERVVATTKYFSYGTDDRVRAFGTARADDCRDEEYVTSAQAHGLATERDLSAMEAAWLEWSQSPDAYAAFAWCRATGFKPTGESR